MSTVLKFLCDPGNVIKIPMDNNILCRTRIDFYDTSGNINTADPNLYNTLGNDATFTVPTDWEISKSNHVDGYNLVVFLQPLDLMDNYSLVSASENVKNFKNIKALLDYIHNQNHLCLKTSFKDVINSNIDYYKNINRYSFLSITNKTTTNFNGLLFSFGTEQVSTDFDGVPGLATEDGYPVLEEEMFTTDFIL